MDINVICIKWGNKFGSYYVNRLYKMVEKNLKLPHRFVCFTDNSEGIDKAVEIRDLPEFNENKNIIPDENGLFKKIVLFRTAFS